MYKLAEKIPIYGEIVKAANRNMVTMINSVRASVFDNFVRLHPESTIEQRKTFANYVNTGSGRGDLGKFEGSVQELGMVFFAPRFAISKFQTPYVMAKMMRDPLLRKEAARDAVAYLGTGVTALLLAKYSGSKVGTDPRDPDFGKIVIGNTRYDIWGGNVQMARFMYNSMMSLVPNKYKKNIPTGKGWKGGAGTGDLIMRFVSYKLSPTVTIPLALSRGKDITGQPINVTKLNSNNIIARSLLPLFTTDAWQAAEDGGIVKALIAGGLSSQGVGVSTYEKDRAKKAVFHSTFKGSKFSPEKSKFKQHQIGSNQ